MSRRSHPAKSKPRERAAFQVLGPGLIAGAADDDPSGIATYSQVGAQFGYGLLWTLVFSYPLMVAIQEISARMGHVTGRGIAGNLRRHYPCALARSLVGLLAIANVLNLGADLGAMGAALKLLFGGPTILYVCLFGLVSVVLEVFTQYTRYAAILKWLCLSLLAYVVCAFVVNVSWADVGRAIVWPPLAAKPEYVMAVVAVFGTTISPYLFFWQAQEEAEGSAARARHLSQTKTQSRGEFARIRFDTLIGMGLSNAIAICIVITTAATLHVHGVTTIQTAAQAAEALRAVAGRFAFAVFAIGIIGTGLLTLPVLAASTAYAVGELFSWPVGLNQQPHRAKGFYAAVTAATVLGGAMNFTLINPIRALYWSAILNGVVAVPVMVAMMHLSTRPAVVGSSPLSGRLRLLGWAAAVVMALTVVAMAVVSVL